jgi:hypothetical protein
MVASLGIAMSAQPTTAQKAIGEVQSSDASLRGSVVMAKTGTSVMSGAQISAGATTAVLKLTRGGEMQICPHSAVTISSSNSGLENLVGLSSGAIEAHYELASNADTVMTPDFRILLPGPGAFHFGFSLEAAGDVCVKSLPGSTSSVIVSEMFGEGTHQVKPGEQIVFHTGRVANASTNSSQSCGCPPAPVPEVKTASTIGLGFPEKESQTAAAAVAAGKPLPAPAEVPPPPSTPSGEIAMKVDAPMIFHSEDLPPSAANVPRSTLAAVQFPILLNVQPPERALQPQKKWYQKVGGAFSRFFRGK